MIHCIYTWQMAQATTGKDKNRRESKAYVYVRLEVQKTGNDSSIKECNSVSEIARIMQSTRENMSWR